MTAIGCVWVVMRPRGTMRWRQTTNEPRKVFTASYLKEERPDPVTADWQTQQALSLPRAPLAVAELNKPPRHSVAVRRGGKKKGAENSSGGRIAFCLLEESARRHLGCYFPSLHGECAPAAAIAAACSLFSLQPAEQSLARSLSDFLFYEQMI